MDVLRPGKPNPIGILVGVFTVEPSLTCDIIADTATEWLVRTYADYLHAEYGGLDCDYVFVNLWSRPVGRPPRYVTELLRRAVLVEVVQCLLGHVRRGVRAAGCRAAGPDFAVGVFVPKPGDAILAPRPARFPTAPGPAPTTVCATHRLRWIKASGRMGERG